MRVKCLAQEHDAVPRPALETGPPDPESSALTIRPPRLPTIYIIVILTNEVLKSGPVKMPVRCGLSATVN